MKEMTKLNDMSAKKLLVADDSLTIQKVIRLALSNEGYEIQAVSDGKDAIEQIPLFRPDIVLIDVSLPTFSAFAVKRDINQSADLAFVRFVLMSSAFEKVDEAQFEEVQFHGRLTKPFDPAHLRQTLIDALDQAPPSFPPPSPMASAESPDDWSTPLMPQELPPIIPPPAVEESFDDMDFLSPPLALPDTKTDIKILTDSTLKMTGMESGQTKINEFDDFQWSVKEPTITPSLPPSESDEFTLTNNSFPPAIPKMVEMLEPSEMFPTPPNSISEDLALPPLPPETSSSAMPPTPPPSPSASEDFGIPKGTRARVAESSDAVRSSLSSEKSKTATAPPLAPPPPAVAVNQAEIEALVKQQVETTLKSLSQKILPEIAERIIKQEIQKLISE